MILLLLVSLLHCEKENATWKETKKVATEVGDEVAKGVKYAGNKIKKGAEAAEDKIRRAWFDYKKGTLENAIDEACASNDKVALCEILREIEARESKLQKRINAYSHEDRVKYAHRIEEENDMLVELRRLKARCHL